MYQIKDILNTIICGDALDELKKFPSESIDMICCSPPYYGLRDYGPETETIWGGEEKCEHKWGEDIIKPKNTWGEPNKNTKDSEFAKKFKIKGKDNFGVVGETKSNFCQKCNAWKGQLGLEPTLDLYLEHILQITAELKRVLKKTGTMWWNHGDSYNSSTRSGNEYYAISKGSWTKEKTGKGQREYFDKNYPIKSLLLQNFRLIQKMIDEQNWILRNIIVWWKPNCMPSSVKDRFTVDYEPVFFFSKNKKYWFEPQYEPTIEEYSPERAKRPETSRMKAIHGSGKPAGNFTYNKLQPQGRNKRTVWRIPTSPFKEAHFAVFPEKLIEPMILAGCPKEICKKCGKAREKIFKSNRDTEEEKQRVQKKDANTSSRYKAEGKILTNDQTTGMQHRDIGPSGEVGMYNKTEWTGKYSDCDCNIGWNKGIVLDPFCGAGTTCVVAKKLGRDFIGIELSPKYVKMAEERINAQPQPLL